MQAVHRAITSKLEHMTPRGGKTNLQSTKTYNRMTHGRLRRPRKGWMLGGKGQLDQASERGKRGEGEILLKR